MLVKTEAIILRAIKYGEQRMIIDMFTRQEGRMAFIVSMPRTQHGRIKKQYFQPLTLLIIEADVRQQLQLQKLKDAAILTPLPSLLATPDKLAIALFTAEFLYHALRDEQHDEVMFDYIRSAIEWLDGRNEGYANFHLVFLMRLSRFLGFYPSLEMKDDDAYFDLRNATFCSAPPLHRDFLMPQEATHINTLMRMDFASMHLFRLSRSQRNRILEILLLYYRLHLPAFPELRSLEVLQELYSNR